MSEWIRDFLADVVQLNPELLAAQQQQAAGGPGARTPPRASPKPSPRNSFTNVPEGRAAVGAGGGGGTGPVRSQAVSSGGVSGERANVRSAR